MAQTSNVFYMVFAINSVSNMKYNLHKEGNKQMLHWNYICVGSTHPYKTKRLASAKLALNKARWKFGHCLKEIYIVKFTPTDNGETKEEKVFSMDETKINNKYLVV